MVSTKIRQVIILGMVFLVSACSMMTESRKNFITEMAKNTPESVLIAEVRDSESQRKLEELREELLARKEEQERNERNALETINELNAVSEYDKKVLTKHLEDHLTQWSELQPEIIRVIQVVQELEYVMAQLNDVGIQTTLPISDFSVDTSNFSTANSVTFENELESPAVFAPAPELSAIQAAQIDNKFQNQQTTPAGLVKAYDRAINNTRVNKVEVGAVAPLDWATDDKFSKTASARVSIQSSEPHGETNAGYNLKPQALVGELTDKCTPSKSSSNTDGSGYALHLASYAKRQNLNDGLAFLARQYKSAFCGKAAVFLPVNVKGREYLSLRLGPYNNKSEAQQACQGFISNNDYCQVTKYEGTRL